MLHTKFHKISLPVLEKIVEGFLPYMGVAAIFVMTQVPRTNFRSPYPRRLHIKFGFDRARGFGGEDV